MSELIDEIATDWLLRLNESDADSQDFEAFNEWCAQAPKHREAFNRVAGLWSDLESIEATISGEDTDNIVAFPAAPVPDANPAPRTRKTSRTAWAGAIAACITCIAVISALQAPSYYADYKTAAGEQSVIHLEDGSIGYLNTDTALDVSIGPEGRRIHLLKGEALFEVTKDPERPFEVKAHAGRSTALGTAYAVRTDSRFGETSVTVTEGTVSVHTAARESARTIVKGGQQIRYSDDGSLGPVTRINPENALAWRRGLVSFDNLPLKDALAEINRYTPGLIILLPEEVGSKTVTATLSIKSLDDGLEALAATQQLSVYRVSSYLTLIY